MNADQYDEVAGELVAEADKIAGAKRPGYTQNNVDVLHNFRTTGARVGTTALQAWGTHFEKHVSAIMSYVKDPNIPQAEPIIGRFADALNYLKLGFAIVTEDNERRAMEAR